MAKTILITDDDPVVRHLLGSALASAGYQVQSVDSGSRCQEYFKQLLLDGSPLPDLVFLDVQLLDISGVEVLGEINKLAAPEHLRVVMLSSHTEEEVLKNHPEAQQASAFLQKPFAFADAIELANSLIT